MFPLIPAVLNRDDGTPVLESLLRTVRIGGNIPSLVCKGYIACWSLEVGGISGLY